MTREEWIEEGRLHMARSERSGWQLAWWLVQGREWDHDFTLSAKVTGYSASYLYTLYRVGTVFPKGRAHPDLSLSAHRELLREPDEISRTLLFARAIEERWTQSDVVAHFDRAGPRPQSVHLKSVASRKYYVGVQVRCPACGHVHPVKGHKVRHDEQGTVRADSDPVEPATAPQGAVRDGAPEPVPAPDAVGGNSADIDRQVPGARVRAFRSVQPGDSVGDVGDHRGHDRTAKGSQTP